MNYAKDVFAASLARCHSSDEFTAAFYEGLLESDEGIRKKFRFTDMETQRLVLEKALGLCADAVAGKPEGLAAIKQLGRSHDSLHLDIKPEWYPIWLDTIVATASGFDPEWNEEIEQAWRKVLGFVTERIASFYDRQSTPS